jgi:hypothetical protein
MTKHLALIAALTLSATVALAQTAAPAPAAKADPAAAKAAAPAAAAPAAPLEMKNAGVPGVAEGARIVKETALVTAVDVANRTLTLKGKDGKSETIKVGPQVERLAEVAVGDTLVIEYKEGLALEFQMPGEAPVAPEAVAAGGKNKADLPPGGEIAAGVRATVTVTAIDQLNRMVVLQGPQGQYHQVKAGPSIQLDRLKVGDKLVATYVQAVAINLEKAPPKPAKAAKDSKKKDAKPADAKK